MRQEEENPNEIYNDQEKAIIEEDILREKEEELRQLEERIKKGEAKIKRLKELDKEIDEISKDEEIDSKKLIKEKRKKRFLAVGLIILGLLIILYSTIYFIDLNMSWGFAIFVTIMLFIFGGAFALRNDEM